MVVECSALTFAPLLSLRLQSVVQSTHAHKVTCSGRPLSFALTVLPSDTA